MEKAKKHMETKQHATRKWMSQWQNQKGNKKILLDKVNGNKNIPKAIGCSKSSSTEKVQSNTVLPQEKRKISN